MNQFFQAVLGLSLSGSLIILVLLFLRLFPRKYPKWGDVALWGLVGLRLMIPFHIKSKFSLVPSLGKTESTFTAMIPEMSLQELPVSDTTYLGIESIIAYVWFAGALLMLIYFAVSYIRIKRRFDAAVLLHRNIYQSEFAVTPIVIGYFRPTIYLPLRADESAMDAIIAHEQTHIRRCDHWWKLLAFLCLSIHWYNPLVWIAYACFGQDVELACDEAVIRKLDRQGRADYAQALLRYSAMGGWPAPIPIAFGASDTKNRVKAITCYHTLGKGKTVFLILCALVIGFCFLTDPVRTAEEPATDVSQLQETTPAAETDQIPVSKEQDEEALKHEAKKLELEVLQRQYGFYQQHWKDDVEAYKTAPEEYKMGLENSIAFYARMMRELSVQIGALEKQLEGKDQV